MENVHVFLGSRDETRGREAVASITEGKVSLVVIDVASDESVHNAAASLASHAPFDVIVNNAGTGLGHGASLDEVLNVNIYGAKRVIDAFLPMVKKDGGRLVGTSSGGASGYVSGTIFGQEAGYLSVEERLAVFANFDVTWEQIDGALCTENRQNYGVADANLQGMAAYGLSKAALTAYHMMLARENPSLIVSTCSPGFINTKMTSGFGASLEPEDGTISLKKCILDDLGECKGWYYGSDGLRSPLNYMRNPGEPEYNPEEKK